MSNTENKAKEQKHSKLQRKATALKPVNEQFSNLLMELDTLDREFKEDAHQQLLQLTLCTWNSEQLSYEEADRTISFIMTLSEIITRCKPCRKELFELGFMQRDLFYKPA